MKYVLQVVFEQFKYLSLIFRVAIFDLKGQYRMHYLGVLWEFLSAAIQVVAYWFVFGVGIRHGANVDGVPFVAWLLIGLIPWFFINGSITQGSNSIVSKVNLVARMNFPISILTTMTIVRHAISFFMLSIVVVIILFIYHVEPTIYLIQLPYYLVATIILLFSMTILFSTISVIIRDFTSALNAVMRILFFLTPVLWVSNQLNPLLVSLLQINPFYYIINGIRDSILYHTWFFENMPLTIYFWSVTLLILYIGSYAHIKFRNKFVDYL